MRVVYVRIGAKRTGQSVRAGVKPLARDRQQVIERGQSAAEQMEFLAMPINVAAPTGELAGAETAERTHELGTHRYGDLRGSGWRGRPPVGSKIDQRHVCLVTDCRDERDHACGR